MIGRAARWPGISVEFPPGSYKFHGRSEQRGHHALPVADKKRVGGRSNSAAPGARWRTRRANASARSACSEGHARNVDGVNPGIAIVLDLQRRAYTSQIGR